jgi:hypothetical protein
MLGQRGGRGGNGEWNRCVYGRALCDDGDCDKVFDPDVPSLLAATIDVILCFVTRSTQDSYLTELERASAPDSVGNPLAVSDSGFADVLVTCS